MNTPKTLRLLATSTVISGLLLAGLTGCSRESRKANALAKADSYFNSGEYDKAEIEYKNALQLDRSNSYAYGRLGEIFWGQGRAGQAFSVLKTAVELEPSNLDARLRQGFAQLAFGNRIDARDSAIFVLGRRPTDAEAPLLLAETVANVTDAAEARAQLEKLPSAQSAPVLTAQAVIRLRERNAAAAEALIGQALQLDPNFAPGHATLAGIFLARQDVSSAEKSLMRAVELSPPRSAFRLQLANLYLQTGRADVAKKELDLVIEKTPDYLPAYMLRATIAKSERQYQQAIDLLKRLLDREPAHPEGLLLSADAYLLAAETDMAVSTLEKAASMYSKAPQVHFQLGRAHLAKGDLEKAAASLGDAIRLNPEFNQAILMLAQVNIRSRNFVAAVSSLQDFLKANPRNGEAQVLLGEAYRQQGNAEGALAVYRALAEANPKNGQIHMAIGSVLMQQDKKADAREAFAKAIELTPGFAPAVEQLVNLDLAENQHAAALRRVEELIAQSPQNGAAQLLLAKVHRAAGNIDAIEAPLKKAIELDPESSTAYSLLSQYYLDTKQSEKAIPALRAVGEKSPGNVTPWMTLGAIYLSKKDYEGAKESFEKVLAINPNHGVALNDLASLYTEQFNDLDKALELALKAREALPNMGETADTLGWIYFLKGQYSRAMTLLAESSDKIPHHPEAVYHAGMAHYMMGNEQAARDALEKALKLSSEFRGASEARQSLAILKTAPGDAGGELRPALDAALARRKDDPIALARLAAFHADEGDPAKAISTLESVLASNPANTNAALTLIRLYRSGNNSAKALELAKSTRKVVPTDGRVAHALGRLTFESGAHLLAVGILQDASRQLAGDPELLFDLGEASFSIGRIAAAESSFKEALAANPSFSRESKAKEYINLIAIAQEPRAEGKQAIEDILKANATSVPALMARAKLNEQAGDVVKAIQDWEAILTQYPEFVPAKRHLTILYSNDPKQDTKALALSTKAREAFPNDPDLAKAIGLLSLRQGNHSRAAALLQESARTRTTDGELLYYLGLAQHGLNQREASDRTLRKAIELGIGPALEADARGKLSASN